MTEERSLIYRYPILYNLAMRVLYGRHFEDRYRAIVKEIPDDASVVDLCCGDCYIYSHYLTQKRVDYLGLDLAPRLVRAALRRDILVGLFNVWQDPIPPADIVMMQASLYHFIPQADQVIQRMLAATKHKVIIAEPIQNLSSSSNPLLAFIGRQATKPGPDGSTHAGQRFDQTSLLAVFNSIKGFDHHYLIPGNRELIGVFTK